MTDYIPPDPSGTSYEPYSVAPPKIGIMAILSLVFGILTMPCCCISPCCSCVWALPSIILGILEIGRIREGRTAPSGKWMAIVGIAMGILTLIVSFVYLVWFFFLGGKPVIEEFYRQMLSQMR